MSDHKVGIIRSWNCPCWGDSNNPKHGNIEAFPKVGSALIGVGIFFLTWGGGVAWYDLTPQESTYLWQGKLCEYCHSWLYFSEQPCILFWQLEIRAFDGMRRILNTMKLYKASEESSYMLIHFSSIYLSMHPYVLLILPHHLQSSHGFTSSSAPGNTETHAFRPVLSAFFFVTRIPDFAGRYKVTPRCCVASMALFACEKKHWQRWEVWVLGATNIFKSWLTLHHPIKTDSVSVLLVLPGIGFIQPFSSWDFRPSFVQILWYLKEVIWIWRNDQPISGYF